MKLPDYILAKGMSPEFMAFAEATNKLIEKLGIKGLDIEVIE
jgi:hypothetical protein